MTKQKTKTLKKTECQKRGCKLTHYDYNTRLPREMPGHKKIYCGRCQICLRGGHFPMAQLSGGVNCHSECFEKENGPIDNARAITALARGGY